MRKRFNLLYVYFLSFLYLEFAFKLFSKNISILNLSTINLIIFVLCTSLLCYVFSKLFSEKTNRVIAFILIGFMCLWFSAQFVVSDVFTFYIDLGLMKSEGAQVTQGAFLSETITQIIKRLWIILIMFVPFLACLLFRKKINFKKGNTTKIVVFSILFIFSIFIYKAGLLIGKNMTYSAYELNYKLDDTSLNIPKLGVLNSMYLDVKRTIFGFEEHIDIGNVNNTITNQNTTPTEKEYKYNNLDIDFNALLSDSKYSSVKNLTQYFMNEEGTKQNDYTGYFKGKNLILFMAESFSDIAVNEEITPTLYKMVNGGFSFSNFYSPTILSTIGGEMQELTGLYPQNDGKNTFMKATSKLPMGIATLFKNEDYKTFAYHDHSYTFQSRNKYLASLGFDNFLACGNGLQKRMNCTWLQNDIDMINATFEDYGKSEEPFMVFYATVSGHGGWDVTQSIAKDYIDDVKRLYPNAPVSVQNYIAQQVVLDRALKTLEDLLIAEGKMDDTVIALVGDHYPYMLTESQNKDNIRYYTDVLGKDLRVGVDKSNMILYNSAMDTVKVDKVTSKVDLIPTLYNLFGLKYDSRLFTGKDALSTSDGLAIFGDRSWVSDRGTYYVNKGKFEPVSADEFTSDEEMKEYVNNMKTIVNNKISIAGNILTKNYYKTAFEYLKETPKEIIEGETTE